MFNVLRKEPPTSKLYLSQGPLSQKFDFDQPPSKKKPFSTILNQPFTHSAQVVLPEELYESVWKDVSNKLQMLGYSRVTMPLSALLEGDFFNTYIKAGDIMMLSEGRPGIDNLYSLKNGQLRLEIPKDLYERAGLVGEAIRDVGRKHMKTRYAIELNLRLPSMLHGKKGFERIVWAFKNVLVSAVTWLFYDFEAKPDGSTTTTQTEPLAKYHPTAKICEPIRTITAPVNFPEPITGHSAPWPPTELEDRAVEMDEWLNLVMLQSPRVRPSDQIDPYLSRYTNPSAGSSDVRSLVCLRWSGFIPSTWLRHLILVLCDQCLRHDPATPPWFSLSCQAFQTGVFDCTDGYTILAMLERDDAEQERRPGSQESLVKSGSRSARRYVLWEHSHA
ncbi:MAG: hypothetical protein LQ349_008685 [Xanthoria aureola]|nr:MAG: hypothetical protein LQ349_008685 [Xanthoria aureola]